MIEETSKGLVGILLWSVLPGFFSRILIQQYYNYRHPNPSSRPKKGSEKYRKHYLIAFFTVMSAYFAYSVGQTIHDIPENFYSKIRVNRVYSDTQLKQQFRILVLQLHPDKNPNQDPQIFLEIKNVYETLNNIELRSGYEVYGAEVLSSASTNSSKAKNSKISLKDMAETAVMNWLIYYLGALIVLLLVSLVNRNTGTYWRLIGLLYSASFELWVLTRPQFVFSVEQYLWKFFLYERVFGSYTVHEKVIVMKSIILNLTMVVTQLLSLYDVPKKTFNEELEDLTSNLETTITGPLKEFISEGHTETVDTINHDEESKSRFKEKLQTFLTEVRQ